MKKSIIALGLVACAALSGVAVAGPTVAAHAKNGIIKDSIGGVQADFSDCSIWVRGERDVIGNVIHCAKGQQFTILWQSDTGGTMETYVKGRDGGVYYSQVRFGNTGLISGGILNIGSVGKAEERY